MDNINMLCDELLQEIFSRLSESSSSSSVSLVSKRWLHLYRTSKTSLYLKLNHHNINSTIQSLPSLLSRYPFLSFLSLIFSADSGPTLPTNTTPFNDQLLFIVSTFCSKIKHLRFLAGPVSFSSLFSLSKSCSLLTSLTVDLSRPLFFHWIANFSCLKELHIYLCQTHDSFCNRESGFCLNEEIDAELGLESLYLSGIKRDDFGFGWLWRSCKKLKKLHLKSCEGVGDGGSFIPFIRILKGLQELELRTCRSIINGILLKSAENCECLTSLLVYDGGSKEGLLHFISNCRSNIQKLDFRLPLDLNNDHLSGIAMNFRGLSSLRLQSCCLVSGEGLKTLATSGLKELALINCDVVERESGLLATIGQNLRQLTKLDLSFNESLVDKELISMLVSCKGLIELRLRGCKVVSGAAVACVLKSCKKLEFVDIMHCCGIEAQDIELLVLHSAQLRQVQVEESKLSDAAKSWASHKFIQLVA